MSFEKAFKQLIDIEKGFVNHAKDRGGATNFGITKAVYEKFKGRVVTVEEIKNMPLSDAKAIYKKWYWDPIGGDQIKLYSKAYALFDQAVNSGVGTAVKRAQKVLGLSPDGAMGPKTLAALNAAEEKSFLEKFFQEAKIFYQKIVQNDPTQQVFYRGWLNRVSHLSDYTFKNLGTPNAATVAGAAILLAGFFLIVTLSKGKA